MGEGTFAPIHVCVVGRGSIVEQFRRPASSQGSTFSHVFLSVLAKK
jgi:hypothetical protein